MSGETRFFLDTNAIVALLQGHMGVMQRVDSAEWLGLSIILRASRTVKLPDAIVMASAKLNNAVLLTCDEQLRKIADSVPGACAVERF